MQTTAKLVLETDGESVKEVSIQFSSPVLTCDAIAAAHAMIAEYEANKCGIDKHRPVGVQIDPKSAN